MRVLTSKVIRIDAFALIHLDMLTFVSVVKVKRSRMSNYNKMKRK